MVLLERKGMIGKNTSIYTHILELSLQLLNEPFVFIRFTLDQTIWD